MQTSRRYIAWRWGAVVLIVLGTVLWLLWLREPPAPLSLPSTENLAPPDVSLPSEDVRQTLQQGMALVQRPPQRQPLASVNLSFLPQTAATTQGRETPEVLLGLVFQGQNRRYAVLNGQIYAPGQRLPDGRRVAAVSEQGVLLVGEDTQQWLSWQSPRVVRLRRGESPQEDANLATEEPAENGASNATTNGTSGSVPSQEALNTLIQQQGSQQ